MNTIEQKLLRDRYAHVSVDPYVAKVVTIITCRPELMKWIKDNPNSSEYLEYLRDNNDYLIKDKQFKSLWLVLLKKAAVGSSLNIVNLLYEATLLISDPHKYAEQCYTQDRK